MDDSPESLLYKADKKAQGHFFSFLNGGPHYDEAAQLYAMAGNKYKLNKQLKEAAECFIKAAFMQQKVNDYNAEANSYVEAANLMKKYSLGESVTYYQKAIDIYNHNGRFAQSAKMIKGVAELFEEEGNIEKALSFYKQAADYFEMDEYGKSQFTQCIVRYADLLAKNDFSRLREAVRIYEKEGEKALRNTLLQFNTREHFFKAGILLMAIGDAVDAKIACDRYDEIDPRFSGSREGKLLRKLVESFEISDVETFVETIKEYDNISKLDGWKVFFLSQAKDTMTPQSGVARTLEGEDEEDPDNVDLT